MFYLTHSQATLLQHLKRHSTQLSCMQHRLPLSLSMLVSGMDIDNCSFFNSNTVPLKLTFINQDPRGDQIPIIFKVCNSEGVYCTLLSPPPLPSGRGRFASRHAHTSVHQANGEVVAESRTGPQAAYLPVFINWT